jgi:hypothetical protein
LRILSLIAFLPLTSVAWAEDDALTSEEIRALIEKMDDTGYPAVCDGTWVGGCSVEQAERTRCLALRENILSDSGDFVVHPVIQTDDYDQREFDKYAGKCRGTAFNKTYVPGTPRGPGAWSESDKGLRLYVVKDFDPGKIDLLVFGRHYGHIESYQKKEYEKAKAEGRQFFPPHFWRSLLSEVDSKGCRVHEIQRVHEPGSGTAIVLNPSAGWDFDKVSIIHIGDMYYIAEYHRFPFDKVGTPTLTITNLENNPAHFFGGAPSCDFSREKQP